MSISQSFKVFGAAVSGILILAACTSKQIQKLEADNPLRPLPKSPVGISGKLSDLKNPPTSETVRLGRWLFYDKRLSADNTVSCATCHRPENAFSEPTPVSTGIRGQKGGRKAPKAMGHAFAITPVQFWDGRAATLEEQALGPIENPIEMGNTHDNMLKFLNGNAGYRRYFKQAFNTDKIEKKHIAKALADYERTLMSGNSPYDRWEQGDESAVNEEVKLGHELFFDKARCNQCHLGPNFSDTKFHNLGVGWDPKKKKFKDEGRFVVTKRKADMGAFKTPGLREVTKHAPYMHDGSVATLEEVVALYNRGGEKNPQLSPKMAPLKLTKREQKALVAFMKALEGEGWQDTPPASFPQ